MTWSRSSGIRTGSRRRKSGSPELASSRRSSTRRCIRSTSSSSTSLVAMTSSGSSTVTSSRCPRRMVSGVRSSWPASSRNCCCCWAPSSSLSSMVLKVLASRVTSSSPLRTSTRCVRSSGPTALGGFAQTAERVEQPAGHHAADHRGSQEHAEGHQRVRPDRAGVVLALFAGVPADQEDTSRGRRPHGHHDSPERAAVRVEFAEGRAGRDGWAGRRRRTCPCPRGRGPGCPQRSTPRARPRFRP